MRAVSSGGGGFIVAGLFGRRVWVMGVIDTSVVVVVVEVAVFCSGRVLVD